VVCSARAAESLIGKMGMGGGDLGSGQAQAGLASPGVSGRGVLELVELDKRLWALSFLVVEA
jgi:hypothetical protein